MTRPIKFRYLAKDIHHPENPDRWEYFEIPGNLFIGDDVFMPPENYRLETIGQFTGLTDKNGKPIYEGDIVRYTPVGYEYSDDHKSQLVSEVSFNAGSFCLHGRDSVTGYYLDEVIGNIHENKELLK